MRIGFFIITAFILISCVKEEFHEKKFNGSLNLTPGVAIPVGYSHLEIEKYLKDTAVKELRISEDGFLTLVYSSDIFSETMGDLLTVSPVTVNSTLNNGTGSTINLVIPGATLDITDSVLIPINTDQNVVRIDSVHIMGGNLQMSIGPTSLNGTVTFRFPGVLRQGTAYSITTSLSAPGFIQDIAGYTIIPEQDASGDHFIRCILSIHLTQPSGPVNNGSPLFDITTALNSVSFETVYGDFSGLSRSFPPVHLDLQIFNYVDDGSIYLAEPQIILSFDNSSGIPLSISFSQLEITDHDNNHNMLTGSGVPTVSNPKLLNYPRLNEEGISVKDSIVLNRANSNIRDTFASNPVAMDIAGSGAIVPAAGSSTTFIRYDSELEVTATVRIPLEGKAEFLVLLDTIAFDYLESALPVPEEIERLIVQLNITNCFPVEVIPQVYLLDENMVLLDSLLVGTEKIEGASDTNGDGKADPHAMDPIYIDLPRNKIDRVSRTHFLVTKGELTTTDYPAEDVRFYSTYFLDYKVGLIARLRINTGKL